MVSSKKFYAVANGYRPGIYSTWGEAEPQVTGFPHACHQGFKTREQAEDFMDAHVRAGEERNAILNRRTFSGGSDSGYFSGAILTEELPPSSPPRPLQDDVEVREERVAAGSLEIKEEGTETDESAKKQTANKRVGVQTVVVKKQVEITETGSFQDGKTTKGAKKGWNKGYRRRSQKKAQGGQDIDELTKGMSGLNVVNITIPTTAMVGR